MAKPPPTLVTKDITSFGGEDYQDISRRRWMASEGLPHRPAAPAATPTMTAAEQAGWDKWLRNNIHNALCKRDEFWRKAIAHVVADLRAEWRREIDLIVEQTQNAEAATRLQQLRRKMRDDVINRKANE